MKSLFSSPPSEENECEVNSLGFRSNFDTVPGIQRDRGRTAAHQVSENLEKVSSVGMYGSSFIKRITNCCRSRGPLAEYNVVSSRVSGSPESESQYFYSAEWNKFDPISFNSRNVFTLPKRRRRLEGRCVLFPL